MLEETSGKRNKKGCHKGSKQKEVAEPDSSDETPVSDVENIRPRAENESGVDQHRVPEDISEEIRREFSESGTTPI